MSYIYIYIYYIHICIYKLVPRPPTFKTGSTPLCKRHYAQSHFLVSLPSLADFDQDVVLHASLFWNTPTIVQPAGGLSIVTVRWSRI